MRLALLDADETLLRLAEAARDAGDPLVWVGGTEPVGLKELSRAARRGESWESLLLGDLADVVVVGRGTDETLRAEQLRKLSGAAVPVAVVHPAFEAMIVGYELEMIRRDVGGLLMPILPQGEHPAWSRLGDFVRDGDGGPLGVIELVTLQRRVKTTSPAATVQTFAADVLLLRRQFGEFTRVTATGPAGEACWGNLVVQLEGNEAISTRWTIDLAPASSTQLTLRGTRGQATLEFPQNPKQLATLVITLGDQETREEFPKFRPLAAELEHLRRALAGEPLERDWAEACRAMDLAEAVGRSLSRRRTIELPLEQYTTEASFKGAMAAGGCGVLVFGLFSSLLAAVLARIPGLGWIGYWPYVLLGLFAFFMALQLLKLVFSRKTVDSPPQP